MTKWIEEEIEEGLRLSYGLNKVLSSSVSKFQTVDVIDTTPFGKALLCDNVMQSASVDEHVYHECLVHPALLTHPDPKTVFIGGGGEGGTAREVLRHKSVTKCVMVDIDGDVVDFCKEHLTQNKAAFADPRLELIIDDAKKRIEESTEKYDVIIMDLDDPLPGGPCYWLYTQSFYETCKSKLNPGGIFVTQSASAGIKTHTNVFSAIHNTLKQVFPTVRGYTQAVYSFCDEWGWNLAFDGVKVPTAAEVDAAIAARVTGELRFMDGMAYERLFMISKLHRKTLAEETHVNRVDNMKFQPAGTGQSTFTPDM
jgi:spermidine synthase